MLDVGVDGVDVDRVDVDRDRRWMGMERRRNFDRARSVGIAVRLWLVVET